MLGGKVTGPNMFQSTGEIVLLGGQVGVSIGDIGKDGEKLIEVRDVIPRQQGKG